MDINLNHIRFGKRMIIDDKYVLPMEDEIFIRSHIKRIAEKVLNRRYLLSENDILINSVASIMIKYLSDEIPEHTMFRQIRNLRRVI